MWDDENDKKLRDAAGNFQPAFDESAWQKMEQLLDKNLPQKKDRKRLFFLLPFLLILAGFIFFIFFYHNSDINLLQSNPVNTPVTIDPAKEKTGNEKTATSLNLVKNNKIAIATTRNDFKKKKVTAIYENGNAVNHFVKSNNQHKIDDKGISPDGAQNGALQTGKNTGDSKPTNSSNSDFADKNDQLSNISKAESRQPASEKNISQISDETTQSKASQKPLKQKVKKHESFVNDFSLSFSAGPGVSAVGNNEGKLTLDFGIGIGYSFSEHFGVRAGIFISKKIYSTTPEQYNLPGGNYNYLEKINANCNVIDLPLNIDYYFNQKGKHNWFVSAGLSSYLMKKESYDYVYKTPGGQVYNKDWTIKNQNEHFFSILNLSTGYQYFLNKRFSLAVQPYIDLPLTGIGAGKVKLNSGGILFTVKAKPFLKKAK